MLISCARRRPTFPITVIGLGSNLLVRDGGIEGVVIRFGRGFGEINIEDGSRLRAGAAVPDVKVARAAADAGISPASPSIAASRAASAARCA